MIGAVLYEGGWGKNKSFVFLVNANYFCYLCACFNMKLINNINKDGIIFKFTNYVPNPRIAQGA